jgi:hypothetical protein
MNKEYYYIDKKEITFKELGEWLNNNKGNNKPLFIHQFPVINSEIERINMLNHLVNVGVKAKSISKLLDMDIIKVYKTIKTTRFI